MGFSPWVRKIPWSKKWQPTPVFLPEKFHGQRSLVSHSSQGCKESDTIERLSIHACASCTRSNKTCACMFTAALVRVSERWKQPRCPPEDEWINKMQSMHAIDPRWLSGKESACNAGDLDLIPGSGNSSEGKGYLFQYSGLENSMDCSVHGVAKSPT